MKKVVILVLFALCIAFSSIAAAEYEYTQEVVKGAFHVFIPDSFISFTDSFFSAPSPDHFSMMISLFEQKDYPVSLSYSNSGECIDILKRFTDGFDLSTSKRVYYEYDIIRVDECAGVLVYKPRKDNYCIEINSTNQKQRLCVSITAQTRGEALSLANGILEHIVAPEMPL